MALHLKLDGARYVFRRRVPKHLIFRLGRGELIRSIGSVPYDTAKREARRLAVASDRLFTMLTNTPSLPQEQIDELAREWFRDLQAQDERILNRLRPDDPDQHFDEQQRAMRRIEGGRELLRMNDWMVMEEAAAELLHQHGINLRRDDPSYQDLCRKLLRAALASAERYKARHDGDYRHAIADPLFAVPSAASSRPSPMHAPAPTVPDPNGTLDPMLFELVDAHIEAMKRSWTGQTLAQNDTTFRFFREHLGNRRISTISRKDVSTFLQKLGGLPAKYGQDRAYRGLTFPQMIEIAAGSKTPVKLLSQKTINRHASALSGLFTWAEKHGHWEGKNPAAGFIDKRGDGTGPKRRPWRKEELAILFRSPAWTGARSAYYRAERGSVVERDAKYWLPLIGLYAGLRLEEACKLRVSDFRQTDGIWVMDIAGNEAGRVKEEASNRTVPVHPDLVTLGLIDHVETVRASGGVTLWPELDRGSHDGKLSSAITKWFGRYVTGLGLNDPGLVFHSFRHTLASALHAAGVSESIAADILGHEHASMSYRVYSEGAAVRPLYEALLRVSFELDVNSMKRAGQ